MAKELDQLKKYLIDKGYNLEESPSWYVDLLIALSPKLVWRLVLATNYIVLESDSDAQAYTILSVEISKHTGEVSGHSFIEGILDIKDPNSVKLTQKLIKDIQYYYKPNSAKFVLSSALTNKVIKKLYY